MLMLLALDGVYVEDGGGVRFAALPEPTTADLERVVVRMLGNLHERWGDPNSEVSCSILHRCITNRTLELRVR